MKWLAWLFPPKRAHPLAEFIPKLPPPDAVPPPYLRPTQTLRLLPIPKPTLEQIRYLARKHGMYGYVHIHQCLQRGGVPFDSLLPDKVAALSEVFTRLDIPFELAPCRAWYDTRHHIYVYQFDVAP